MPPAAEDSFDPNPIIERLSEADVDFVVIGGVAGGAHGSSYGTFDLDIAYSREPDNLERLAEALRGLGARLRGAPPGVPFQLGARSLRAETNFTFLTDLGSLDILSDPAGAPPYERLKAGAVTIALRGHEVRIASLDHLIGMKEASGRLKDKLMATEYRMLSDELRAPRD